jgi:hypothetical protein
MHRTAIALLVYLAGAATACGGGGNGRETEFSAPLVVPTAYAPPPGGFALRWVKASQGVEIAGLACTGLKSADGSVTVDASGRFSASG